MPGSTAAPLLGDAFARALQDALNLHRHHTRRGTSVPYTSHLLSVAALVLEDGGDEEEAIAALLHDALEDCPEQIDAGEIEARYGPRVREIVEHCTDTPPEHEGGEKPEWRPRKEAYLAGLRTRKPPLLRVSLADKLHNARSILRDLRTAPEPEAFWERFRGGKEGTLWYYRALTDAYREVGVAGYLIDELERVVARVEREAGALA